MVGTYTSWNIPDTGLTHLDQENMTDTFKGIFLNESVRISIEIPLKFSPKCSINNIPSLVQIMAWRRPGGKPLSEPMMVSLLTNICITRPQLVKVGWTEGFYRKIIMASSKLWDFTVWKASPCPCCSAMCQIWNQYPMWDLGLRNIKRSYDKISE